MITLTEEQITDAHTKAPQSTREWMASQQVSNLIPEIMRRHRAEEMAPSIAALVGYILIGLFPVRELPLLLTRETSLPPEQILQIAQDIRREILAPVARDLAALQPQAEQSYAAALRETGSTPAQQPVSDTSVQQGPPLPPKPQFPQAPPAPPQ